MENVRLYIGCNVQDVPTHTMESVCDVLRDCKIKDATITSGYGFYKGEMEQTIIVTMCDLNEKQLNWVVFELCVILRDKLEQECIGVERFDSMFTWE